MSLQWSDYIIRKIFRQEEDIIVPFGTKGLLQKHTPTATIPTSAIWRREPLKIKIKSILTFRWHPSQHSVMMLAKETFFREIFGEKEDFSEPLFELMLWHCDQQWELKHLTETDKIKADAIEALTVLTRMRYWHVYSPNLNLSLGVQAPLMCNLIFPMIAKIPIRSIQYFVDAHCRFAFNSIRQANHKSADDLIAYLYEVLYLQQKLAVSFHEYLVLIDSIEKEKQGNILHRKEIDAIINVESIISYLKASFEKTIALIGYTYNISGLESKGKHSAKLNTLRQKVDASAQQQPYFKVVHELISENSLQDLNNYRTGILHKKGLADLQPHNYVSNNKSTFPLKKMFHVLHEQHAKCSITLIGALALLTDELVKLDHPKLDLNELPRDKLMSFLKEYVKN